MTTPHGIKLDYDYGIYTSSTGSGTATIGEDCVGFRKEDNNNNNTVSSKKSKDNKTFDDWRSRSRSHRCQRKPYNVTIDNVALAPTALAEDLLDSLRRRQGKNCPVSGIYSYDDDAPIPLNWGEIVPLLLLPNDTTATTTNNTSSTVLPLIWTFPHRRYDHAVDMVPELLDIGADLMEWVQQRPERIAVVVSGDLSHTHHYTPSGPYGFSNASAPYDNAIGRWAAGGSVSSSSSTNTNTSSTSSYTNQSRQHDPCDPEAAAFLLRRAKELQPRAKSCGFTGYVLWHGMMCSTSASTSSSPLSSSLQRLSSSPARTRKASAKYSSSKDDDGNDNGDTNNNNINDDDSSSSSNNTKKRANGKAMKFHSKVLVNRNVTYYGMIAAVFKPVADDDANDMAYVTHAPYNN